MASKNSIIAAKVARAALIVARCSAEQLEAIAVICENEYIEDSYVPDGTYEKRVDDAGSTLANLASRFRSFKPST